MTRLLVIVGQLFLILAGYIAASLAGSAFLHLMVFASAGFAFEQLPAAFAGGFVVSIPVVALFVAWLAFKPAAVAVLVTELFGLRRWHHYALAGGGVGAVVSGLLFQQGRITEISGGLNRHAGTLRDRPVVLALIGAGMVAGIAYWIVAGRFAGAWNNRRVADQA